jgi:dTDP-4-dehydrorhamnose reductase
VKLLVTGAGGQVGREFSEFATVAGDDVIAFDHARLDITDAAAVDAAVGAAGPDAIVHAAAWTAVDACEGDPERADRVNAVATQHVVEAARRHGAAVAYLSTDYVFDGTKPEPYVETDAPSPRSVYGRSKLAGERALDLERDLVVRISWVCGRYGNNMVKTLLRLASEGVDPSFVTDQRGHPTIVHDLVPTLRRLIGERRTGIHHVTNQGVVSWFEFAQATFAAAGHDPARVSPITTAELDPPRPAPRPANSVLENAALAAAGIPLLPDFRDSLRTLVTTLAE